MRKVVFISIIVLIYLPGLSAKDTLCQSSIMGIGVDLAQYSPYYDSYSRHYKFGIDAYYQFKSNFNIHASVFYSNFHATDFLRRNDFTQISYSFKMGPEYRISLWKAKYRPRLVLSTQLGRLYYRSRAEYDVQSPYYNGQIQYAFDRPLNSCWIVDFGAGLQAEYRRFRLKVSGFIFPRQLLNTYYVDNVNSKTGEISYIKVAGYGWVNENLNGNVFLYYTFNR